MLMFERVLVTCAHGHDFGHIGLVERRQHGGGILRVLEPPRDGLTQPRHRHALLAILLCGGRWRRWRRSGGGGRWLSNEIENIPFEDLTVLAGSLHGDRIEAM